MTPVTTFADKTVALFGLGGSGLATALALQAGGAHVVACDDNPAKMAEANAKGIETGDLRNADWSRFASLILSPRRAADPSRAALVGEGSPRRRASRSSATSSCSAASGRRSRRMRPCRRHRHQRQVDHDGAHRAYPARGRPRRADGRQYRHCDPLARTARRQAASTSSSVRRSRSISRRRSHRPSASISTSRPITSTGTERWSLRGHQGAAGREGGQSPSSVSTIRGAEAIADACDAGRDVARISIDPLEREGVFADGETLVGDRWRPGWRRSPASPASVAARRPQCAERRGGCRRRSGPRRFPEENPIRPAHFPRACRIAWRRSAASGDPLHQRFQGHQRDSTEKALNSFDRIFWILGGKAKEGGIEPLTSYFPKIEQGLSDRRGYGGIRRDARRRGAACPSCGTLDKAVAHAAADAQEPRGRSAPSCCSSPACASYDQFPNYEVRGNHFRDLVRPTRHRSQGGLKMVSRAERSVSAIGGGRSTVCCSRRSPP